MAQESPGSSKGSGRASPEAPVLIATAGLAIHHNQQHEEDAEGGENQAEVHRATAMSDESGSKSFNLLGRFGPTEMGCRSPLPNPNAFAVFDAQRLLGSRW